MKDFYVFLFILLYGVFNVFSLRLEFKYNPWLFIDLYIGRKNLIKFIEKHGLDDNIKL